MQITADVGKISKTVQYYLMFIFDELSEFFVIFASNLMFSAVKNVVSFTKDDKEVSWMYHRVIRFWFLLNFLFISALFDILALLSISCVFPSGFSGRRKSSCLDIPRTIIKCVYIN